MTTASDLSGLVETLKDSSVPSQQRAETLTYMVQEYGLDMVPVLTGILTENDEADALRAKLKEEERSPLQPEFFLDCVELKDGLYAAVTVGGADTYIPCDAEDVDGMEQGDPVLIDVKNARLAGRDGQLRRGGEVVTVESIVPGQSRCATVKFRDTSFDARVKHSLVNGERTVQVGDRVLYDSVRNFVHDFAEPESDGTELLTPVEELTDVDRDSLVAHPILDEIFNRVMLWTLHPELVAMLDVPITTSYLLSGPTGTGKTMHINVLASDTAGFVEELTGERQSRLVVCSAADFYDPYFGVPEKRVVSFVNRLKKAAAIPLTTKDGEPVIVPLIVVIEECEALFRMRGEMGGSSHLFDRPLSQILQAISSAANEIRVPVIFVCSTNAPHLLDPAARRRFGRRQATFGTLTAGQAASLLEHRVPPERPLSNGSGEAARPAFFNKILAYVYGNDPDQSVAQVHMQDGTSRTLKRLDLVTGAMLDTAVAVATDVAVRECVAAGRMVGLDADAVIAALHDEFAALASTLRPHNLREHCPQWFSDESAGVVSIRSLVVTSRRPRSMLIR